MRDVQRPIYFVCFSKYIDSIFPRPAWRHKRHHFLWGVPVFSSTSQRPWARTNFHTQTAATPILLDAVAVLICGLNFKVTNAAAAPISWVFLILLSGFVVYPQLLPKCLTGIDRHLRPLQAQCRPDAGVPQPSGVKIYIKGVQMSRRCFGSWSSWAVFSSRKQSKHLT